MKQRSLPIFWYFCLSAAGILLSVNGYAQGLGDVKALCGNATAANKAMAKQAGYDLDALCNEVTSIGQTKKAVPPTPKVPRPTAAAETATTPVEQVAKTAAPVAVAGVSAAKPAEDLKPFGYDLFANAPTTFAPAASIPVSADYLLGPGDTLDILFYGKSNSQFSLEINREGFVDFPELGPVGLAGLTYGEAKEMLRGRIAAQIIGTQVSISMGSLRSMQIFVLGEAFKPGAYTVSSLSTITHALISAGGISDIGSLRQIQLKRGGKLVAELDLYDLLMKGDTSNDVRIQAADVIYIPTVGSLVSVSGQVLRPAIYELKGGERVDDLINLAGGLGDKAFAGSARIERIGDDGFMTALDLNLKDTVSRTALVKGGDHLTVDGIMNRQKDSVNLTGHVNYPGIFAFKNGMRVSSLVNSIDQFPQGLDLQFGMISREDPLTGLYSALSFAPSDVLQNPGSAGDVLLQSRDQVMFFSDKVQRGPQLERLIQALRAQARAGELAKVVSIVGSRLPGTFPLVEGMRISHLLDNGGGLQANYADLDYALLVREELVEEGDIKVYGVDLRALLTTPGSQEDLALMPKDQVILFSKNENKAPRLAAIVERLKSQTELGELAKVVRSGGTVKFPGEYPLTEDMSISDLIALSGGLIASAYSQSAEISRSSLQDPNAAQTSIVVTDLSQSRLTRLAASDYAEFRTIPDFRENETITLEGEFVFPGTYVFEKGEMLSSVIERAGGFTDEAFVDGSVFLRTSLRQREQEEIDRLITLLNDELSANSLRDANSDIAVDEDKVAAQRSAIAALSNTVATGRLVIPLSDIVSGLGEDVVLKDGDRLLLPKFSQEVTIIGEVRRPTSYLFDPNFGERDYIEQSGGFKDRADKGAVYVVKAGGEVVIPKRGLFRFQSAKRAIGPGDTIVVPLDTDDTRIRGIPLMAEVSTIIYQLALGSAAVRPLVTTLRASLTTSSKGGNSLENNLRDNQYDDEIDLRELFGVLWGGKIMIIAVTALFAVGSVFYALATPNQYKATTLLVPAQSGDGGLSSALGQLGGLASLAGVSIGGGESSESQIAQEIMKSWSFVETFIAENNLEVEVYAAKGWSSSSGELQIDHDVYDIDTQSWLLEDDETGELLPPTSWELFKRFSEMLSVSQNKQSGLVSVSIEYYSPVIAKEWLDLYIAAINEHMQARQVAKVSSNISYLEAQIAKTSIAEMREVFYTIIEEQTKNKMVAEASPDYAFIAVSPSMIPEEKSQPKRALICVLGALLGGLLGVLVTFMRHYVSAKSDG